MDVVLGTLGWVAGKSCSEEVLQPGYLVAMPAMWGPTMGRASVNRS